LSAPLASAVRVPDDPNAGAPLCRNCGAVAGGRYCPECAQATALHPPTVREFLHEFVGHHIAVEGALWRTLKALLITPGRLTADYFAGRRARYIAPLRLYLTFSLVLFAVAGFSDGNLQIGNEAVQFKLPSEIPAEAANQRIVIGPRMAAGERTSFPWLNRAIDRMEAMTPAQRNERITAGMRQYLPYVLIVLVPVLALVLKIFYWNRHRLYGEHLVVAFHAQTVVFFFALISETFIGRWLGSFVWLVLFVQGFIALRRVYGGRWWPTILREGLVFLMYGMMVSMALALTATLALAL
jgi:hypothetical protein